MKKVYRLHEGGAIESDWFSSVSPGSGIAITIKDNDTQVDELPSSIPSPFARMDLVRIALKYVNSVGLDGTTYHHKLVSEMLDVGQILFNYDTFKDDLKLLAWNKNEQINALEKSPIKEHKELAKTLKLFFNQDKHFNFNFLDNLYILKYKHKVIGGTSPTTLFFAAPFNDRKDSTDQLKVEVQFGKNNMFDEHYFPLYKREPNFIKYLYALSQRFGFSEYFGDLYEYIDKTKNKIGTIDGELSNQLNDLEDTEKEPKLTNYFASLQYLHVTGNSSNTVQVLRDMRLYKYVADPTQIEKSSGFVINSNKKVEVGDKKLSPLVLPTDRFNFKLRYTHEIWDPDKPAPVKDDLPVAERRLPHVNDQYPYLTKDDFFEDTLIKLPYDLNQSGFFTSHSRYLVPLKSMFFEYFSISRLKEENLIEIKPHTDSVDVVLNIPIKGNEEIKAVTYTKTYKVPATVSKVGGYSGISSEEGAIQDLDFGIAITPPIRNVPSIEYRVGLINMNQESPLKILFFDDQGKSIAHSFKCRRSEKGIISEYYVLKNLFDLLQVNVESSSAKNFLIPDFSYYNTGNTKFSFAIDFGTSNTHIEYKTDNVRDSKPFDINFEDLQILYTFDPANKKSLSTNIFEDLFTHELFPREINNVSNVYNFPIRTAILRNKNVDILKGTYTFNHYNIAFDFEKKEIKTHLDPKTNLKWSNYNDLSNRKQLEHYIEHILILLRNKVLLNRGDIHKTEIVWFFPSSMGASKIKALTTIWKDKVESVFGANIIAKLRSLPESVAPFYFYNNERGVASQALPIVSIDIGGGTADIVVYKQDKPKLLTSFRFAGNSIFGDGFGGSVATNGYLTKYLKSYKEKVKAGSKKLHDVLEQLINRGYSEDIINFLFNLATNKELLEKNIKVDFARELANDGQLKIVILVYFTSIFYHLINILEDAGFEKPSQILLSGNGSKAAFIADQNSMDDLALIFNILYDKVSKEEQSVKSRLIIEENPKVITAKGGLYSVETGLHELDNLMVVNIGAKKEKYPSFKPYSTLESTNKMSYQSIAEEKEIIDDIVDEINRFFKIFLELHKEINFQRKFGLDQKSIKIIESFLENENKHEFKNDILRGLEDKKKELDTDVNTVEETLFFYPLTGALNRLANSSVQQ